MEEKRRAPLAKLIVEVDDNLIRNGFQVSSGAKLTSDSSQLLAL